MKFERRKAGKNADTKPAELPYDYLRLVEQTVSQAMLKGLVEIRKIHPISDFYADGTLYNDEVLLTLSLHHGEKVLAATTVHASADFAPGLDPEVNPGEQLEKILGACVDAASSVFDYYLDPKNPLKIKQLADASMGSLEDAPFEWTLIEKVEPKIYVKMDKTNPKLEDLAEKFLNEHDPDFKNTLLHKEADVSYEAEEFLEERLTAIKKARDGGGGQSGPIRH